MDQETLDARRNELSLYVGAKALNLSLDYMFINQSDDDYTDFDDREELSTRLQSQLTKKWALSVHTRHDLTDDGGPLEIGSGVQYENECFIFETDVTKAYTYDRDYQEEYRFLLTLVFKTLGKVETGWSRSGDHNESGDEMDQEETTGE